MLKCGCGEFPNAKFWISLGLPVGAMINCADNTKAKNLLPAAGVGDMWMATVKKGRPQLRKKDTSSSSNSTTEVILEKDGMFLYSENNRGQSKQRQNERLLSQDQLQRSMQTCGPVLYPMLTVLPDSLVHLC
ncbi:unnamed protein product [Nyctereutes procyonoides]|uniref:Large ribosomal subunit protein uL14 n=1 Tax=Nyctereutes procyonoides TaxID=34880 RepID=A0A811ZMV9_NYCPR|nr:unnamed protein product [Nyctereutes procyonoides]